MATHSSIVPRRVPTDIGARRVAVQGVTAWNTTEWLSTAQNNHLVISRTVLQTTEIQMWYFPPL